MAHASSESSSRGPLSFWTQTPLYLRIMAGLILGLVAGFALGPRAEPLIIPARLVLRLLGALAPFLILIAVVRALMTANLGGKTGLRLATLLITNTLVAIVIGLSVANVLQPGRHASIKPTTATSQTTPASAAAPTTPQVAAAAAPAPKTPSLDETMEQFMENVPKSILGPLGDDGRVIGVIIIALAFGIALRPLRDKPLVTLLDAFDALLEATVRILGWIIEIVPLAVFGVVASIVGTKGFAPFKALAYFIVAVLVALALQLGYYMLRVKMGSWVRPGFLLRQMSDAALMAFSTSSSTITMPLTFKCLREKVKLREESASLGALVGSNFNNDGTALYEAMAALFVGQMLGLELSLTQQLVVVGMSVVASVGAAGIPEAGLVTMTLVFNAVGLPPEYIAVLLPVDWFLDRSRTVINMMGDTTVACVLDGKVRGEGAELSPGLAAVEAT
ncbi:MAG TPA: dicarboxylate/amino acid:cation symporter [Abditibacterium sp.]|jgi:DAACS family dicarboxylate/amino acid:cation (Na+ or H+) symporter